MFLDDAVPKRHHFLGVDFQSQFNNMYINVLFLDVLDGLHVKLLEDIIFVQERSSPESPVPYIILHPYTICTIPKICPTQNGQVRKTKNLQNITPPPTKTTHLDFNSLSLLDSMIGSPNIHQSPARRIEVVFR